MGITTSLARVVWVGAILLTSLAQAIAEEQTQSTGAFAGLVLDEAGKAVSGAKIQVEKWRSNAKVVAKTCSDATGRFLVTGVPTDCRYCVVIDVDGLGREFREDSFVFPNRTTDLGGIQIAKGCVCDGRIVGINGGPAPHVEVVVETFRHELGHTISSFGTPWRLKTDEDGRYVTPPLPVSFVDLKVAPPKGFVMVRSAAITIEPKMTVEHLRDMKIAPEALIEGVVTDEFGKPIADAEVGHNPGHGEFITTRTDALGHFALGGCSATTIDKARISVEARGFATYEELERKNDIPRRIRLTACGYITGRAVDAETGEPVQIERIVVCEVKRDNNGAPYSYGCGEARFDQPTKGVFRASVSTKGEKHITVMAQGYQAAEEYALGFGLSGEAQNLTIKMRRSGAPVSVANQRIRGLVTANAIPVAEAWVSLWEKREEKETANATMLRGRMVDGAYRVRAIDVLTDGRGEYLLDAPDPGDYYVVAQPFEGPPAISELLHLAANEDRKCDLAIQAAGTVRGCLAGIVPSDAQRFWVVAFGHAPYRTAAPVDRNGEFVLSNVPPGEIGLKAGHEGYWDADVARYPWTDQDWEKKSEPWRRGVKVAVRPGETVSGVELTVPPAGPADSLADD